MADRPTVCASPSANPYYPTLKANVIFEVVMDGPDLAAGLMFLKEIGVVVVDKGFSPHMA